MLLFWDTFKHQRYESYWVTKLHQCIAIIFLLSIFFSIYVQVKDIAEGSTFFQTSEVASNASGCEECVTFREYFRVVQFKIVNTLNLRPDTIGKGLTVLYDFKVPNVDIFYGGNYDLVAIPYSETQALQVLNNKTQTLNNSTIYLTCNYILNGSTTDCGLTPKSESSSANYSFNISKLPFNKHDFINFQVYLPVNFTMISQENLKFVFWDPSFVPNKIVTSDDNYYYDNTYFQKTELIQDVSDFQNHLHIDLDGFYWADFHKIVTNRNLVNRGGLEAFFNYLGLGWKDTISVISLTRSEKDENVEMVGAKIGMDQASITVQDEIRLHTVISLFSSLGGLYSFFAMLYVILFGKKADSPWGFVHFFHMRFKGAAKTEANEQDNGLSGVTFVDGAKWLKERKEGKDDYSITMAALIERQILTEEILKDYFLETKHVEILAKIRKIKDNIDGVKEVDDGDDSEKDDDIEKGGLIGAEKGGMDGGKKGGKDSIFNRFWKGFSLNHK